MKRIGIDSSSSVWMFIVVCVGKSAFNREPVCDRMFSNCSLFSLSMNYCFWLNLACMSECACECASFIHSFSLLSWTKFQSKQATIRINFFSCYVLFCFVLYVKIGAEVVEMCGYVEMQILHLMHRFDCILALCSSHLNTISCLNLLL